MSKQATVQFQQAPVAMTGEDFGYLLSKVPGTMFWLGVASPTAFILLSLNRTKRRYCLEWRQLVAFKIIGQLEKQPPDN